VRHTQGYIPRRYSAEAKELLESYDLDPPPKVVEVDLRGECMPSLYHTCSHRDIPDDSEVIKTALTRLTGRSTFPNILVKGNSLGGSDEIYAMHMNGTLGNTLRAAGVNPRAEVPAA
jgi:glutaredoxin 3